MSHDSEFNNTVQLPNTDTS